MMMLCQGGLSEFVAKSQQEEVSNSLSPCWQNNRGNLVNDYSSPKQENLFICPMYKMVNLKFGINNTTNNHSGF